eukprot:COSAG01_NODE_4496_length_4975_cov_17.773790_2_plen_38_part_00
MAGLPAWLADIKYRTHLELPDDEHDITGGRAVSYSPD